MVMIRLASSRHLLHKFRPFIFLNLFLAFVFFGFATPYDVVPKEIELRIGFDGTESFDANDEPGNDSGPNNGIVRTNDLIGFDWFYNTDIGGATNPILKGLLPEGLDWKALPQQAVGPLSGIYDGAAYLANGILEPGGDGRLLIVHLADINGTVSSSVRTLVDIPGLPHGTEFNNITFEFSSDELSQPLVSNPVGFRITAAPNANINVRWSWYNGTAQNETGTETGVLTRYALELLHEHPTRNGLEVSKGIGPLEDEITFTVNVDHISPNARLMNFIPPDIEAPESFGGDGAYRNYEYNNGKPTFGHHFMPFGTANENNRPLERSTVNSGNWQASQPGGPGTPIFVKIIGADTTGEHFPTRVADGNIIPNGKRYLATGGISLWIPVEDILAGDDKIRGNEDDGQINTNIRITNFDPLDASGTISNFGTGTERTDDNERAMTIRAEVGLISYNFFMDYENPGLAPPNASGPRAGDGAVSPNTKMSLTASSSRNSGIVPLTDAVLMSVIDNSAFKVIPFEGNPQLRPNDYPWASSRYYNYSAGTYDWMEHGVDFVVEFGTGGQGGDEGWDSWEEMTNATANDEDSATLWSTDPTNPALGGEPDPDTGVRNSITKYRVRLLKPIEPGDSFVSWVGIQTLGPSSLENEEKNPLGGILATFGTANSSGNKGWWIRNYDPLTMTITTGGDRITLTDNLVRNTLIAEETIEGSEDVYLAGTQVQFRINGEVVALAEGNAPAKDVVVTAILPDGMFIASPESVAPQITDYAVVQYYDGQNWVSNFPLSGRAYGLRWQYGEEEDGATLPEMSFKAFIPVDAPDGTTFSVTSEISSISDFTDPALKNKEVELFSVQNAAVNGLGISSTPLFNLTSNMVYDIQIANVSTTPIQQLDVVSILPYNGDYFGSTFNGTFELIGIEGLPQGMVTYVTTLDPATLDARDENTNGYFDPGRPSSNWYEAAGTGVFQYTLEDVINGVAGAPSINEITALRFVTDGSSTEIIPLDGSVSWKLSLRTLNVQDGDLYYNQFVGRVEEAVLPLPIYTESSLSRVVDSDFTLATEVMLDPTGENISIDNNAHWGELLEAINLETVYFRLTINNIGTSILANFDVSGLVPEGASYIEGSVTGYGRFDTMPTWTLDLLPGTNAQIIYAVTTVDQTLGTYTANVTANVTDGFGLNVVKSDDATYITRFDQDCDGTDDQLDANISEAVARDDAFTIELGETASFDILANDDFLPNNSLDNLGMTTLEDSNEGTARGTILFDDNTGVLTYRPTEEEECSTVTVIYEVCNDACGTLVCARATVSIEVYNSETQCIPDPCEDYIALPPAGSECDLFIVNDLIDQMDFNGTMRIENVENFPDNDMKIYNRWGTLVWQTKGYVNDSNAFDGISNTDNAIRQGDRLPSGVYYYLFTYARGGESRTINGYLYINE